MDLFDIFAPPEEETEGRIYGLVNGKITNASDPKGLGRVRARFMAQADHEESDWLIPLWPGAMEGIPDVNEMVAIGFFHGDPHRGFYAVHPISTTQGRATEHMVLGDTAWGIINFLVEQVNTLRTDFNTFVLTAYNFHTHAALAAMGTTLPSLPGVSTTAAAAVKGKDGNGATVANVSTSRSVLSRRAKVK